MEHIFRTIEGPNIRLRDISENDLTAYRYWQQPGHDWQALDGPYYPKLTQEEVEKLIETLKEYIATSDWPEVRTRLMIADQHTDKLLGSVSRYWISQETHWAALGIVIFDSAWWRKGLGYEALGLWMDYLFSQFPEWVRLDLRTWSGNQGMIRLAQKLGYRQEACFRKARIVEGDYYDGLGFGILRDEWSSQFPDGFAASFE
jgi:putative hydrolase of HD superfamily